VLGKRIESGTTPGGGRTAMPIKVVDRQFGPVPESEFDPDRLARGPRIEKAAETDENFREPESFADWYRLPLLAGLHSLVAGAIFGLFLKRSGTR
jgi:hypothetical protein